MSRFTSRKFIISVISMIGGVAASLVALDGTVGKVCAIISAVIPAVTYIITEGVIDAKAVGLTTDAANEIIDIITDDDEAEDEAEG